MPQESPQAQDPNHKPQPIQPQLAQLAPQIEQARQSLEDVDAENLVASNTDVASDVTQILQPNVDLTTLDKDALVAHVLQRLANGGADDADFVAALDGALLRHANRAVLAAALAQDEAGRAYVDARVRAANSAEFIKEVIKGYFALTSLIAANTWNLAALKNLWNTLQMVPDSHVRGRIDQVELDSTGGGDQKGTKINIGKPQWRRLGLTMGGRETNQITRGRGNKFLMKSSPYSERMRSKNMLMATSLHEIGHAVDYNLLHVPKDTAIAGRWEQYDTSIEALTRALIEHSGLAYPVIDPQAIAQDADVIAAEQDVVARDQNLTNENARLDLLADQAADHRVGAHKRGELAWSKARVAASQAIRNDAYDNTARNFIDPLKAAKEAVATAKQNVTDRAWFDSDVAVPQSALHALIEELAAGRSFNHAWAIALVTGNFADLLAAANIRPSVAKRQVRAMPMVAVVVDGAKYGGWMRKRSELAALAGSMHGRVFHKTAHNPGQWVSYEAAAKDIAVSHYQFHAPAEWFAELYSHFYAGTMTGDTDADPTHPLYQWFLTNIARRIDHNTTLGPMPGLPQQQQQ